MDSLLNNQLTRLPPIGPEGFEGLIASLLEHLTGQGFYLASSGRQSGRDMSSSRYGGSVIAAECKRYGKDSELDERSLQGELTQASVNIPDLDLWVLVTSRDVPDQVYSSLSQTALFAGIEFRTISAGGGSPSSLETLCAHSPETVLRYLRSRASGRQLRELCKILDSIARHTDFSDAITRLKEAFAASFFGYENWRITQNQWLTSCFQSEQSSRAAFGQSIIVAGKGVQLIERKSSWEKLDQWWMDWSKIREPFVLLGEEGDGKTWSAAFWIVSRLLRRDQSRPVIFLSSRSANSRNPRELLREPIRRQLRIQSSDFWEKRLERWLRRAREESPALILVLDGINERQRPNWWRELLEQLQDSPWRDQVALLITCRADYWKRHFENLRHLPVQSCTVPPYNDLELKDALASHGVSLKDISGDLFPLIRKPRYLNLIVRHRQSMAESGDITRARLIYEDWHDRWQRKTTTPLDDEGFQQLIQDLARRKREGLGWPRLQDISALLPPGSDIPATLDEVCSSRILNRQGSQYKVDEHRLVLGFGLLLAEEVRQAGLDGQSILDEVIAGWLEPHREMDLKTDICGYAALHSLIDQQFPKKGRNALLKSWLDSHTPGHKAEEAFSAHLPISPESYLELAELVWADRENNPWAEELMMQALLRWRTAPKVLPVLRAALERWLGFVHPNGFYFQRGNDNKNLEKVRTEIAERVGHTLLPGSLMFLGYPLTVVEDDGLLRLGRVALAVISYLPRRPYLHALTIGCVAEAVMGRPEKYELFAWVLRSSGDNIWNELRQEVGQLLARNHVVAMQAAHRLLSFEGSEEACRIKKTLPEGLFPRNSLWERYKKDPCGSGFAWRREDCESCLRRNDLAPRYIATHIEPFCIDPSLQVPAAFDQQLESLVGTIPVNVIWSTLSVTMEDHGVEELEPAMYRYAPSAIAGLIRRIVRSADNRDAMGLRQLSFRLTEHYVIFGQEERDSVKRAWMRLQGEIVTPNEVKEIAESLLFKNVLINLPAAEQFNQIFQRPPGALDLFAYRNHFQPITDWSDIRAKLDSTLDPTITWRILWFLSAHAKIIPEDVIRKIIGFLDQQESYVRGLVLKILCVNEDKAAAQAIANSTWCWEPKQDPEENHWGSLLLSEHGSSLPYAELRSRVHPAYLGYAVRRRGAEAAEVRQYAEDINRIWLALRDQVPDLPPDFPPTEASYEPTERLKTFERLNLSGTLFSRSLKFISRDAFWGGIGGIREEDMEKWMAPAEPKQLNSLIEIGREAVRQQLEAGNGWFEGQFSIDALDVIVRQRADLVHQWVNFVLAEEPGAAKVLMLGRSFYEALCEVLLREIPEKGMALYRQLKEKGAAIRFIARGTKIPLIDYILFRSPESTELLAVWECWLKDCQTDREIMEVAIVAQTEGKSDWLWSQISLGLDSPVLMDEARALTTLAFMDDGKGEKLLSQRLRSEPETWIDVVAKEAWYRWQTHSWAKHWFNRFLTAYDDTMSWAAFRLFLRCVDSRFWLWCRELKTKADQDPTKNKRCKFFEDNLDGIMKSIEKNEKSLRETFLGQKILENQAWPWMKTS